MKHRTIRALLSALILTGILLTMTLTAFAGDGGYDGAAFGNRLEVEGFAAGDGLFAWVDRADETAVGEKINDQTLYPQRTGWLELDQLMEEIFAGAGENATPHEKLRCGYDYLVKKVTYSWEGYSYTVASVASYNSVNGYNYLTKMTYEEGIQKSIPDDMANRTYHILKDKKGVCYDYAIAIAVMARYLGLESYVETGLFVFEDTSLGAGHHGWALVEIGGETYIFDPQRDARNYQYYGRNGYYYGIPYETGLSNNYRPSHYSADVNANQQRREEMLPVTADRTHGVTITATAAQGGTVTGGGKYTTGDKVTLQAAPENGYVFLGWQDLQGKVLSRETCYTFPAAETITITASFEKNPFGDVPQGIWYAPYAVEAYKEGLIQGTAAATFSPDQTMTRGMVVTVLANLSGEDLSVAGPCPFVDVDKARWYYDDICWAWEKGIVKGTDETHFCPDDPVTREQLLAMIMRYLDALGVETESRDLPYTDVADFSNYALPYAQRAQAMGLIQGYTDGSFRPGALLPRCEGVTVLVRLARFLAQ